MASQKIVLNMTSTIPELESRKVELDRMMENLRATICSSQGWLETLKQEKRVVLEEIDRLKGKPELIYENQNIQSLKKPNQAA